MNKISSQDRSALIRLASSLPAGSPERRSILAGLDQSPARIAAGEVNVPGKHILDNAEVYEDAKVADKAKVYDGAKVYGYAQVYENAKVYGDAYVYHVAKVYGNAQVYGDAAVKGGWITDDAQVYDNAVVSDDATVSGNAKVFGKAELWGRCGAFKNAQVYGNANVGNSAKVSGNAKVFGSAMVWKNAMVYGNAQVYGKAKVYGDAQVFGNARIGGTAIISGGQWDGSEGEITSGTWSSPPAKAPAKADPKKLLDKAAEATTKVLKKLRNSGTPARIEGNKIKGRYVSNIPDSMSMGEYARESEIDSVQDYMRREITKELGADAKLFTMQFWSEEFSTEETRYERSVDGTLIFAELTLQ